MIEYNNCTNIFDWYKYFKCRRLMERGNFEGPFNGEKIIELLRSKSRMQS